MPRAGATMTRQLEDTIDSLRPNDALRVLDAVEGTLDALRQDALNLGETPEIRELVRRIDAYKAVDAAAQGRVPPEADITSPEWFDQINPAAGSGEVDARHNREYAPREIRMLLENSGFTVDRLETGEFRDEPHPEFGWIGHLLERYRFSTDLRGDGIYAVGRKTGPVRERRPDWLYT